MFDTVNLVGERCHSEALCSPLLQSSATFSLHSFSTTRLYSTRLSQSFFITIEYRLGVGGVVTAR